MTASEKNSRSDSGVSRTMLSGIADASSSEKEFLKAVPPKGANRNRPPRSRRTTNFTHAWQKPQFPSKKMMGFFGISSFQSEGGIPFFKLKFQELPYPTPRSKLQILIYIVIKKFFLSVKSALMLASLFTIAPGAYSSFSLDFAVDSKYVSEGRDNLNRGGLASISINRSLPLPIGGEWYYSSWYAEGISSPYTELNLSLGSSFNLGEANVSMGYTWLDFRGPHHSDNEFNLGLAWGLFGKIDLSSALIYSTEAEGSFIELMASTDWERENWVLTPYLLLGINQGYVQNQPKTFNNLQFGLTAETELFAKLETAFHLATTTGLEDIIWAGVTISLGSFPHPLPQDPTQGQF